MATGKKTFAQKVYGTFFASTRRFILTLILFCGVPVFVTAEALVLCGGLPSVMALALSLVEEWILIFAILGVNIYLIDKI